MADECRVQLDAEVRKQSSHGSRLTTAVMAFALCLTVAAAAAFVVFVHHQSSGHDEDTYDLRHTLRQISNVRAAIHLEGEYNPDLKTSVEWKNQVDQTHSQGGLRLVNNEILVPRSGLYFVYSQVSFEVSCSSGADAGPNDLVHLSHAVQRWSHSYGDDGTETYRTILHSARTACQRTAGGDGRSWFTAVYMGAVFSLNRGDRLRTVMDEKMLPELQEESGKNFFGVFAL